MTTQTIKPIRSTLIPNLILYCDGQAFDGFRIVIEDDEEFAGTYEFTHEDDEQSAHEAIFGGGVEPV